MQRIKLITNVESHFEAFSIGCGVFFSFLLLILLYMIIAHPDFTLHPFGGDGGPAPVDRQPMFLPSARPTEFKAVCYTFTTIKIQLKNKPEMLPPLPPGVQGPAAIAYANQACKKKQADSVGDSSWPSNG